LVSYNSITWRHNPEDLVFKYWTGCLLSWVHADFQQTNVVHLWLSAGLATWRCSLKPAPGHGSLYLFTYLLTYSLTHSLIGAGCSLRS